jgi:signal transduction histidine kinase
MQWTAYLSDVQDALRPALERLAPHVRDIDRATRRILSRLQVGPEELRILAELRPEADRDLRRGRFEEFRKRLEEQAHGLARRGVAEEHARVAWFARVEAALPYLVSKGECEAPLVAALLRLALAGGFFLSAAFDQARAESWRAYGERERQRLSRDLHDEIGHDLVVLKLYLEMIAREVGGGSGTSNGAGVRLKLEEAMALIAQSLQSVRRLILDLGPAVLEEVGFLAAVRLYARQFASHTGLSVEVRERGVPPEMPSSYETALYRVVQGALSNVVKHARARSVRIVVAAASRSRLAMMIEDDGVGFDPEGLRQSFGLQAMRERVESLGGRFSVESRPAGGQRRQHGTRIAIELPLGKAVGEWHQRPDL